MPPPSFSSSPTQTLTPEPLTHSSFAPFGSAIIPPLPCTVTSAPKDKVHPANPFIPAPVIANQASALKYSPISPLEDHYGKCPSGKRAEARMSMFSCFPRRLRSRTSSSTTEGANGNEDGKLFDVTILERHPYSTQTFSPLGLAADENTYFLVIVAPTLTGTSAQATLENGEQVSVTNPPDLSNLRAFVVRGDMAVTYGAGTWHAPMVVVGNGEERKVDFVVTQFVNGVGEEDCQEVMFKEGVVVELGESQGGKKAKL